MPAFSASAPGKIILFGEHAVVYGRPAIAIPVSQVRARAMVMGEPRLAPASVRIQAVDLGRDAMLDSLPENDPLAAVVRGVFRELGIESPPAFTLRITSTIPQAAGMGSGAAVSVAVIRAVAASLGRPLPDEIVSALAYEVEKLYHGTPSGVDNTVITYAKPVYFVRGQPVQTFQALQPFKIVIGDTGIKSPTVIAVGDLRRLWQENSQRYEPIFDRVGELARLARQAIESGQPWVIGPLMNENHLLLQQMGVSSPELDELVRAARQAGALGAKLSGGGRGGNMIALVSDETDQKVVEALLAASAVRTITTVI